MAPTAPIVVDAATLVARVDRALKPHKNVADLEDPILFSSSSSFLIVDRGRATMATATTATKGAER